jgi:hypothetical protein
MLTEEKFLNTIDEYQKNFYFHPEKRTIREMNVVEEEEEEEEKTDPIRMNSVVSPTVRIGILEKKDQ